MELVERIEPNQRILYLKVVPQWVQAVAAPADKRFRIARDRMPILSTSIRPVGIGKSVFANLLYTFAWPREGKGCERRRKECGRAKE